MNEITFEKERIASRMMVSKNITIVDENYIDDRLTYQMGAFIFSQLRDKKTIEYTFSRPSFKEWLFRKNRIIRVTVSAKDVLLDPPEIENTVRLYSYKMDSTDNV